MSKNVVWWIGVKNDIYAEKYGGWDWMDCSRKSWEFWCKKNDVLFVPLDQPIETDLKRFRVNWQKAILAFDELDKRGIDYDQICLVDGAAIIKWNTPNFFKLTDHKLTAWRDMDNMRWVHDSIQGYKEFFNGFELDQSKYVNSSPMIFNKNHKKIFQSFKQLYYDNVDTFVELQDKIVRRGTEQTPLNYWLQINNVEIKTDLSLSYKLTHIHRKQMFSHNWQLNENQIPFFIKYGYIWYMQGFPKEQRNKVTLQIWDMIKHNYDDSYILNQIDNKKYKKYTTSQKFKEDILYYFSDPKYKQMNVLELGSCHGDTTRILAERFNHVYGYEIDSSNIKDAKKLNNECNNVTLVEANVYSDDFELPDVKIDVAFIDAGHTANHVQHDINRIRNKYGDIIMIFDDYGQPDQELAGTLNQLNINRYIGENAGFVTANGVKFITSEGVICNMD